MPPATAQIVAIYVCVMAFWIAAHQRCVALDATFSEPNFFADYAVYGRRPTITTDGVNSSMGAKIPQGSEYAWSQLIHKTQIPGVPCCSGAPIVPLSILFQYKTPQAPPNSRLTGTFVKLNLYGSVDLGPSTGLEIAWTQAEPSSPLGFEIAAMTYLTGGGAGQVVSIGELVDNHWYRLAASIGRNDFYFRLDDYGVDGISLNRIVAQQAVYTGASSFPIHRVYPGVFAATAYGGGAVVIDEFHDTYGDFNLDGTVDGNDFLLWQVTQGRGDRRTNHSGDSTVDRHDLAIWKSQFGRSALPDLAEAPMSRSVPEPQGAFVTLLAVAILPISRAMMRN